TLWDVSTDTSSALQLFEVSGSPPGAVVVSESDRAIAAAALPPPSTQLGTSYTLDTADFRISDAVWSRGLLWLGLNEVCPGVSSRPGGSPAIRSASCSLPSSSRRAWASINPGVTRTRPNAATAITSGQVTTRRTRLWFGSPGNLAVVARSDGGRTSRRFG